MGYEYWVSSPQPDWLAPQGSGHAAICAHMATLPTWVGRMGEALCLKGFEHRDAPKAWRYDVRVIFCADQLLLEISAYPPSVDQDLRTLCQWLREHFDARVLDEDGEPAPW